MAEINVRGIFSIGDVRSRQLRGLVPERTRESFREYGYFAGGRNVNTNLSSVSRIDYSNDTLICSSRSNFSVAKRLLGSSSNTNFGYFAGGDSLSTIDRVNYSNDLSAPLSRGPLSLARVGSSGSGNSNFGYFSGGTSPAAASPNNSSIDRVDYANDNVTASIRGPLSLAKRQMQGVANSNFGYVAGGFANSPVSIVDRISYSNDTRITLTRGPLSLEKVGTGASGNNNFAWIGGGSSSRMDRIDYSNDTTQALNRVNRRFTQNNNEAANGNSNFGYFGGGTSTGSNTGNISNIDRIDYSNDTASLLSRGFLTIDTWVHTATSSASFGGSPQSSYASNFTFPTVPNAGYFGGGSDGTNLLATIDKVDYANDTSTASVRSALSSARYSLAATGNGNFGYFAGGRPTPSSPDTSTIDRIEYSSDTQNAVVRSTLNNTVRLLAAAGNSNFGYFSGGFPTRNGVDRLDYSTDTTATSPRQGLPLATYSLAATGNRNFGYFCGGLTASPTTNRSEIYRVDYFNDSTIPQNRGPLSEAKREGAATGNDNFGYFGGAVNPGLSPSVRSQIERIDYSNDTVITSVRSRLNTALYATGATGNSNFGYFGGGTNGPANFSVVDRINYSNDTAIASIRGPLSTGKSTLAATSPLGYGGAPIYATNTLPQVFQKQITFNDSNTLDLPFKRALGSFGYFGGGDGPSSRVDRINYSNDLVTASVRGSLSLARTKLCATGNSNFGYFGGGYTAAETAVIDRLNYSNDTATLLLKNSLSSGRKVLATTSNNNFGYFGGGYVPGQQTNLVQRLDYSNDSQTLSTRGPLSSARKYLSATGNSNFGYYGGGGIGGGGNQPSTTLIDRINYSNDTVIASIRNGLSVSRRALSAAGNSNFGYFGGGLIGGGGSVVTTVDRIDYSNDTSTASIRGPLSLARCGLAATGNSNFGYFGGGSGPVSRVDRIDYLNDTTTAFIRGTLTGTRYYPAATTNARTS